MKVVGLKQLALFLSIFLYKTVPVLSATTDIYQDQISDGPTVALVNDNLKRLNQGKLDLHPGNIVPKRDSVYTLGASGTEWLAVYTDSVFTSTITASSATITNVSITTMNNWPAFAAYTSANFTLNNSAETATTFDAEESDTDGVFNGTTVTIPTQGWYQFNSCASLGNPGVTGLFRILLWKNNTSFKRGNEAYVPGGTDTSVCFSGAFFATSTDTFKIALLQTTGGNRTIIGGQDRTWFNCSRIK